MPFDDIFRIFKQSRTQPNAVDRYTKRPIYFEDEIIKTANAQKGAYGLFYPHTENITISRKAPNQNKITQHEILHSIFNLTRPEPSWRNLWNLGNPSGTMVTNARDKADQFKNMSDIDYEHNLIDLLQHPELRDVTLQKLLRQNAKTDKEKQAHDALKRMFRVK